MVGGQDGRESTSERWMLVVALLAAVAVLGYRAFSWGLDRGHDFHAVWEGAALALDGRSPYEPGDFIYFPSTLVLATPFAWVSFEAARAAFLVVAFASVVAGLVWSSTTFGGVRPVSRTSLAMVAGAIIAQPVTILFASGNWNSLVFITTVAALDRALRDRWTAAGVLIGLGAAIKPSALALFALPVLAGGTAALASALATTVGLVAVGAVAFPDPGGFLGTALPFISEGTMPEVAPENLSLVGIANHGGLPTALVAVLAVALTVGFVLLAHRLRGDVVDCASALLVGSFLAGPSVWNHYLIFLVPWLVRRPFDAWRAAAVAIAAVSAIDLTWHLGTLALLLVAAELVATERRTRSVAVPVSHPEGRSAPVTACPGRPEACSPPTAGSAPPPTWW